MTLHPNAKLTSHARRLLVDRVLKPGWSIEDASQAAGVSVRTGWRWIRRWREEGPSGLLDRRSVPHRIPRRTPPSAGSQSSLAGNTERVAGYQARFAGMAYPDETYLTSLRKEGDRILVEARPVERDAVIIWNAAITLRA